MGRGQELYNRAKEMIPGGTQLLSKRPEMFLPDLWPAYYNKAKGCEVWDLDENHYYDMSIMGVGANVLGYAFDEVDQEAKRAIDCSGMCTLNAPEEVGLAEKLLKLHPWADMVRYAKAGGEAMSVAARIARAYTGKDLVLVCGYHGWHDWYLSANLVKGDPLADVHLKGLKPAGVPRGLAGSNLIFHYNDMEEFQKLVMEHEGEIAAVIMEPIRNDDPNPGYLEEIRKITRAGQIVLVFDEITAGFRLCAGGSHLVLGVEPDIAVFGKAMANGYPVSAIIGRKNVMEAAQDTFISSTFWTERIALAAAVESINCYRKYRVEEHQKRIGEKVQEGETSDRTASVALNYRRTADRLEDEMFDGLLEQYRRKKAEIEFFHYCVSRLSGKLPEVITDMVVEGMDWQELSEKYGVSHTMIGKYRRKALKEMDVFYEIREKNDLEVMLS